MSPSDQQGEVLRCWKERGAGTPEIRDEGWGDPITGPRSIGSERSEIWRHQEGSEEQLVQGDQAVDDSQSS